METSEEKNADNTSNNKDLFVGELSDEDEDKVPKDFMCPSYYACILFADPGNHLILLLTDDTSTSKKMVVDPREQRPIRNRNRRMLFTIHY